MLLKAKHLVIAGLFLAMANPAYSCVGKILYVGAGDTAGDKIMAELLVLLINERTGTNVQIRYFANNEQLYEAFKSNIEEKRVDIIVEDTGDGLAFLGLDRMSDPDQEYLTVKEKYDEKLGVIWLNPFGFKNNASGQPPSISAPLLRRDILTNFPLLPRILNKLAGKIDDPTLADIVARVDSGDKPKNVAKDFLRSIKLI